MGKIHCESNNKTQIICEIFFKYEKFSFLKNSAMAGKRKYNLNEFFYRVGCNHLRATLVHSSV
jgi:hypothetical protein